MSSLITVLFTMVLNLVKVWKQNKKQEQLDKTLDTEIKDTITHNVKNEIHKENSINEISKVDTVPVDTNKPIKL